MDILPRPTPVISITGYPAKTNSAFTHISLPLQSDKKGAPNES
jgi:hypothetical protein